MKLTKKMFFERHKSYNKQDWRNIAYTWRKRYIELMEKTEVKE